MQFDILTIFPNFFDSIFAESIISRARAQDLVKINIHDLRKWTNDKRGTIDDKPFGGGAGMLMMVEPIYKALTELGAYPTRDPKTKVLLTSAAGKAWDQKLAQDYSESIERVIIICGHYEGIDHRVSEHLIDHEISVGNYVLTGGELPAAIIVDSIARLRPGVLGNPDSLTEESHSDEESSLEYPQYTRPADFTTSEGESWGIPEVLLSGNHQQIRDWRKSQQTKIS